MPYIAKGEQFWNEDHTEGYEILEDIEPLTVAHAHQFKPLGAAPVPEPMHPMPDWARDIFTVMGGVDRYRERQERNHND